MLAEAQPTSEVLTLKGFEAYEHMADGQATKIIVPTELQSLVAAVTTIAEAKKDKK